MAVESKNWQYGNLHGNLEIGNLAIRPNLQISANLNISVTLFLSSCTLHQSQIWTEPAKLLFLLQRTAIGITIVTIIIAIIIAIIITHKTKTIITMIERLASRVAHKHSSVTRTSGCGCGPLF